MKKLFKTDSNKDTFCEKYNCYVGGDVTGTEDTLSQLEENFEAAFGKEPTAKEMKQALKFAYLFLAEIGTTCARTLKARAASEITDMINDEDPVETAAYIAAYRTD
jgi:hypothetical protein